MKHRIITFISVVALGLATIVTPLALSSPVHADAKSEINKGFIGVGGTGGENLSVSLKNIINTILFVLGAVAVIMIIIGGFRYVLSAGDSSAITAAKNTIFYAVIGLVIAILAYAIVNFVLTNIK